MINYISQVQLFIIRHCDAHFQSNKVHHWLLFMMHIASNKIKIPETEIINCISQTQLFIIRHCGAHFQGNNVHQWLSLVMHIALTKIKISQTVIVKTGSPDRKQTRTETRGCWANTWGVANNTHECFRVEAKRVALMDRWVMAIARAITDQQERLGLWTRSCVPCTSQAVGFQRRAERWERECLIQYMNWRTTVKYLQLIYEGARVRRWPGRRASHVQYESETTDE